MTEASDWALRELPVLRAAVECLDKADPGAEISAVHLAEKHVDSLSPDEVRLALKRLALGGYVTEPQFVGMGDQPGDFVNGYTGEALRAIGAWPSPETALERLVAALTSAADSADDPEVQSALRKSARWLGTATTAVGVNVASAVIGQQF